MPKKVNRKRKRIGNVNVDKVVNEVMEENMAEDKKHRFLKLWQKTCPTKKSANSVGN